MIYRITLPATLVAGLVFGAVPALAAGTTHESKVELSAFEHGKITLGQAIASAEKLSGGKVTDASFERMNGKSGYAVTVFANNKMEEYWVDPVSGQASPVTRISTREANIQSLDKVQWPAIQNAKTTLPQAVTMAEQHSGGKAMDVGIEKRGSAVAYNVEVLKDGKLSTYWVDPTSGQITTQAQHAALVRKPMTAIGG
jgi:uncharacterized membrane protein YkoI